MGMVCTYVGFQQIVRGRRILTFFRVGRSGLPSLCRSLPSHDHTKTVGNMINIYWTIISIYGVSRMVGSVIEPRFLTCTVHLLGAEDVW